MEIKIPECWEIARAMGQVIVSQVRLFLFFGNSNLRFSPGIHRFRVSEPVTPPSPLFPPLPLLPNNARLAIPQHQPPKPHPTPRSSRNPRTTSIRSTTLFDLKLTTHSRYTIQHRRYRTAMAARQVKNLRQPRTWMARVTTVVTMINKVRLLPLHLSTTNSTA